MNHSIKQSDLIRTYMHQKPVVEWPEVLKLPNNRLLHMTEREPMTLWQEGRNKLRVLASWDLTPKWGWLLHISMSYPHQDPTWREIKAVRDLFFTPEQDCMMILPRHEDYINQHAHCFHLWQTPEDWRLL